MEGWALIKVWEATVRWKSTALSFIKHLLCARCSANLKPPHFRGVGDPPPALSASECGM